MELIQITKAVLDLLKKMEWIETRLPFPHHTIPRNPKCAVCQGARPYSDYRPPPASAWGHKPDCELATLIHLLEKEVR